MADETMTVGDAVVRLARLAEYVETYPGALVGLVSRDATAIRVALDALAVTNIEPTKETVRDPHHDGWAEWKLEDGCYYHRGPFGYGKWVRVSRIHPTPARIAALASLAGSPVSERGER